MGELEAQVAIVTGAASGIGEACARALAAAGAALAIVDRDADGAARVAADIGASGGTARAVHADLADAAGIPGIFRGVVAELGRVDILVNGAAITADADTLLDASEKSWDRVYAVNLRAPLLLMREFARHAIERGGGGRIVNVSSSSAFRARGSPLAYGSAKAALGQITRSAAAELGPHGINVNAVAPGITRTGMTRGMGDAALQQATEEGPLANLFGRVSEPADVAQAVLFLCLPGSRQITAQTLHTSAGAVV